jgi:Flp pilus assembly protein TadG
MRNKKALQHGQSLVEFALILPILLLILIILFDLGRAVYYYSVVHNAAREGARYGIINNESGIGCITPDTAGIESAVLARAIGLNPDNLSISSACDDAKIRVTVSYQFEPVTPLASSFLNGGMITLKSISSMNVEG